MENYISLEGIDNCFIGEAFEFSGLLVQLVETVEEGISTISILNPKKNNIFNIYFEIDGEILKIDDDKMCKYAGEVLVNRIRAFKLSYGNLFAIGLLLSKVKNYKVVGSLNFGKLIDDDKKHLDKLVVKIDYD